MIKIMFKKLFMKKYLKKVNRSIVGVENYSVQSGNFIPPVAFINIQQEF